MELGGGEGFSSLSTIAVQRSRRGEDKELETFQIAGSNAAYRALLLLAGALLELLGLKHLGMFKFSTVPFVGQKARAKSVDELKTGGLEDEGWAEGSRPTCPGLETAAAFPLAKLGFWLTLKILN